MRVLTRKPLAQFWAIHPDAETPLRSWISLTKRASWKTLVEVQADFPHADLVGDCIVFNIGGNKYRLIVDIDFPRQRVYIRAVLTHKEYDRGKWKDDCNCKT